MKIFSIHLFYFLFIFLTKFFPFLTKAVMIVIIVTYIISAIFYITITNIIIGTAQLRMISIIVANYNTMFIVVFMYIMLLIIITS